MPTPTATPGVVDGWHFALPPASFLYPVIGANGRFVGFAANCVHDSYRCNVTDAYYSDNGIDWSMADAADALTDAQGRDILMTAIAPYSHGFVATGSIVDRATDVVVGGVWTSQDGTAWSAVNMPPIDLGSAHNVCEGAGFIFGNLHYLAAVGSQLVAVGYRDGPRYCHSRREYIALGSADGTAWQPLALPVLGSGGFVTSLLGGSQFMMVTRVASRDDIWTSPDGSVWDKANIVLPDGGHINDIVETANGYVAVGSRFNDSETLPIVATSADGSSWHVVPKEQLTPDFHPLTHVVLVADSVFGSGIFGIIPAHDNTGDLPILGVTQSTDGMTWDAPETEAFVNFQLTSLISDGDSVIAYGYDWATDALEFLVKTP